LAVEVVGMPITEIEVVVRVMVNTFALLASGM
jgi:hypothetical protein